MKKLDLHGIRHEDVKYKVESFLIENDLPVEIVSGNSLSMKKLIYEVLQKYEFDAIYQNPNNLGSITVVKL